MSISLKNAADLGRNLGRKAVPSILRPPLRRIIQNFNRKPSIEEPEDFGDSATWLEGSATHPAHKGEQPAIELGRDSRLPVDALPHHLSLVKCIGRGSFGSVWIGHNELLDHYRAIKVIPRCWYSSQDAFLREPSSFRLLQDLTTLNPHLLDILNLYQVECEEAGEFFIADMRLADDANHPGEKVTAEMIGGYEPLTVKHLIENEERLPMRKAAEHIAKVASGLQTLHEHGLVHRDIKPGNIVFRNEEPCIADYSLLNHHPDEAPVGTPEYLEESVANTPQQDIAALGRTLSNLITKAASKRFFAGRGLPQEFLKFLDNAPPDERRLWGQIEEVIDRATSGPLALRYTSAKEMADDLEAIVAEPESRSNKRFLFPAAMAIAALTSLATALLIADRLIPRSGSISWPDAPLGATIEIGTASYAAGDAALTQLPPQTTKIRFLVPDHTPIEQEVKIRRARSTSAPAGSAFEPNRGHLQITMTPPGASVSVNGEHFASTPQDPISLPPGDAHVVFSQELHLPEEFIVEIHAGETTTVGKLTALAYHAPPQIGEYWASAWGGTFAPVGNDHRMELPISYEMAIRYLQRSNLPSDKIEFLRAEDCPEFQIEEADYQIAALTEDEIRSIKKIMAEDDRARGTLAKDQYYRADPAAWGLPEQAVEPSARLPYFLAVGYLRPGKIVIQEAPPGASVAIDGELRGLTDDRGRLTVEADLGERHHVTIQRIGYHTYSATVEIPRLGVKSIEPNMKSFWGQSDPSKTGHTNSLGMRLRTIDDLLFAVTETRNRNFMQFCKESGIAVEAQSALRQHPGLDHPATYVTLDNARAFCRWLTAKERAAGLIDRTVAYRLPNDLEWSRAAGLNEPSSERELFERIALGAEPGYYSPLYAWGDNPQPPPQAGNLAPVLGSDSHERTCPVDLLPPNKNGIKGIPGNVREWVADQYHSPSDGRHYAIARDSSFATADSSALMLGWRSAYGPNDADMQVGFRVVLAPIIPPRSLAAE